MSAPLKRRVALLEASLAAEKEAHRNTFAAMRDYLNKYVDANIRNKAALEALQGADYFEGVK